MSENKQTNVPGGQRDDNRPYRQEERSLSSSIVSGGADVGACVGTTGAAPELNSSEGGQNMQGEDN